MRKVGGSSKLPTGGGYAESGLGTDEDYAAVDHVHQLWTPWDPLELVSPWTGTLLASTCGNLIMVYMNVSNTTSNQVKISEDAKWNKEYEPLSAARLGLGVYSGPIEPASVFLRLGATYFLQAQIPSVGDVLMATLVNAYFMYRHA